MKFKKAGIFVLAGGALVVGAMALTGFFGMGGDWHRGMNPERAKQMAGVMVDNALDRLEATDQQREEIHALEEQLMDKGMALRGDKDEALNDALALWQSDSPDPQQVHALVDARVDNLRQFAHEAADALLELHGILTPEQRGSVEEHVRERHGME